MVCIILVEAAYKSAAESLVAQLQSHNQGETFVVPLVPLSGGEPTHWGCSPICSAEIAEQIRQLSLRPDFSGHVYLSTCDPAFASEVFRESLDELGLFVQEAVERE